MHLIIQKILHKIVNFCGIAQECLVQTMEKSIVKPVVPYLGQIPGGPATKGKIVRIQGVVVPHDADRFVINLQTGPNTKPSDDVVLHISVRLKEGYIARNSYRNGEWEREQGKGKLPIGPGQHFEIIIRADEDDFKIAINGQHFCEFPYRFPIDKVSYLAIEGDVGLNLISWEGRLPSESELPGGEGGYSSNASNAVGHKGSSSSSSSSSSSND